jgi:5'-AMP-activated protein kinase catalytic alpha subunit
LNSGLKDPVISKSHAIYSETCLSNFAVGKVLGLGSYAIVKLATHVSGLMVAIKSYNKKKLSDPVKKRNVDSEISILKRLEHPNIIKIYCVIDSELSLHLVMEYLPYIPLSDFLRTKSKVQEGEGRYLVK